MMLLCNAIDIVEYYRRGLGLLNAPLNMGYDNNGIERYPITQRNQYNHGTYWNWGDIHAKLRYRIVTHASGIWDRPTRREMAYVRSKDVLDIYV